MIRLVIDLFRRGAVTSMIILELLWFLKRLWFLDIPGISLGIINHVVPLVVRGRFLFGGVLSHGTVRRDGPRLE